ncbi:MAG: KamA family radical SAM protein [Bdellovibrionales bacterium]
MKLQFKPTEPPPGVALSDWQSWQWQLGNRLSATDEFVRYFQLSENERLAFSGAERLFKVQATPYYASLASRENVNDPIRRMILPLTEELSARGQQVSDPLGEKRHSPVKRLVHRYPDRVLFLVTDTCSVYCRYCLRKYFTGQDEAFVSSHEYQAALAYIREQKGIREVILSGGDPLTLSDSRLLKVISDLRAIEHVELIRIGTRMPVVCPMRITPELVQALKGHHPVYMMVHFNHPRELTAEAATALTLLVDNGFPVFNQMVLLRGVNNHAAIVQALSRRLLRLRIKPYYMFQCDPSEGTDHFRISIEESLEIQRELWGRMSGLAMPNLSLDIPGGGGKVGLTPDFIVEKSAQKWRFQGWDGFSADYLNPQNTLAMQPSDVADYLEEWQMVCDQQYGSSEVLV